jgi:hypothetical protein
MRTTMTHLVLALLFAAGIQCALFPRSARAQGLRWDRFVGRFVPNPFIRSMNSKASILYLRVMGCFFIALSVAIEALICTFGISAK